LQKNDHPKIKSLSETEQAALLKKITDAPEFKNLNRRAIFEKMITVLVLVLSIVFAIVAGQWGFGILSRLFIVGAGFLQLMLWALFFVSRSEARTQVLINTLIEREVSKEARDG
jgi:hypothetical protein